MLKSNFNPGEHGLAVLLQVALAVLYSRCLSSPKPEQFSAKDFDTTLKTRRTINNFEPKLPSGWEEIVRRAVHSAIYAPNHKRTEPWLFHLLGPETKKQICELNAEIVSKKKGEKAGQRKLERWLEMPGWLIVTCKTESKSKNDVKSDKTEKEAAAISMDNPSSLEREDYAACCCAVQNLCLSLHNAGFGTKWGTGKVNFDPRFSEIVGLSENEYVVGTIWFGTPTKSYDAPPRKRNLHDVIVRHP